MKYVFVFFLTILIVACNRDCSCECEKFRYERSIIATRNTSFQLDTFTYYDYKVSPSDTTVNDSIFQRYMMDRYYPDSFIIYYKKDSFKSVRKVSGITCAGTNQYYQDSFFCTCSEK